VEYDNVVGIMGRLFYILIRPHYNRFSTYRKHPVMTTLAMLGSWLATIGMLRRDHVSAPLVLSMDTYIHVCSPQDRSGLGYYPSQLAAPPRGPIEYVLYLSTYIAMDICITSSPLTRTPSLVGQLMKIGREEV
jgi:hypothetical protein